MKMKISGVIVCCIFFICWCAAPALAGAGDNCKSLRKELQQKLDELCKNEGFPGVTAAVILPGDQCISLASGFADIEAKRKMKPLDRMMAGSIGKTYAAAVALQLMKEKKFSLEDKIGAFFKKEPWFPRLPNANDITVRMLMNHTGGLPRYVLEKKLWEQLNRWPDKVWTPEERLAFILDAPPVHPAGKGWSYSDTDYIIVGMIIEKVTGNSFYKELESRVLKPRGLKYTSPSDRRRLDGLVPGYTGNRVPPFGLPGKMMKDGVYLINPQFEWTGGGLVTNSTDLARFIKLLLEGKVVDAGSLKMMKQAVNQKTGKPGKSGYGLALEIWDTSDGITYGHRGTMPGYLSITEYVPRYGFAIAMQINADGMSGKLTKGKTRNDYIAALKPVITRYLAKTTG
jgi:D-alanyl-D-alanine carboxypeptidase